MNAFTAALKQHSANVIDRFICFRIMIMGLPSTLKVYQSKEEREGELPLPLLLQHNYLTSAAYIIKRDNF